MKVVLTLVIMVLDSRLEMFGTISKLMLSREVRSCLVMNGRPELLRECAGQFGLRGHLEAEIASKKFA